jgi:hypothetical protein
MALPAAISPTDLPVRLFCDFGRRRAVYSVKASGFVTAQAYTLIEVHIQPGGVMLRTVGPPVSESLNKITQKIK